MDSKNGLVDDMERIKRLNSDLAKNIDHKEVSADPFLEQLRAHINAGHIHMVDMEDMGTWKACNVAKLKDGTYVVFHPR